MIATSSTPESVISENSPLRVPPFYCPIPFECAPGSAEVDQRTVEWLDRFRVFRDREQRDYLARMNVGLFAALTIPDGPTERRQVYSDLFMLIFAVDDALFDESVGDDEWYSVLLWLDRVLAAPASWSPGADRWPVVAAVHDVWSRLAAIATPAQECRWVSCLRSYLLNVSLGTGLRRQVLSLDDYTAVRLGEGAMGVWHGMIPVVGGYELADAEVSDPRVCALADMANIVPMLDNDIFSTYKEAYRAARYGYAPAPANLITILARDYGCNAEVALERAVALRDRVMCQFMRLREEVLADASPGLTRYVIGLGQWIRGYIDWAMASTRYRDLRNPSDEVEAPVVHLPTTWAERPADDNPEPVPLSSIAWYWNPECHSRLGVYSGR